jgi:large subunit ribosomal protein L3
MAGQYGNVNKTIQNLTILEINDVDDLLYVKGSVPGPKNGYLTVRDAIKFKLPENVLKPAGLKENKNPDINTSNQKEIVKDDEVKTKSENVEVKNEELNNKKEAEQAITSVDKSSDTDKIVVERNIKSKEV